MHENSKKISRKELYNQVWITPMSQLAQSYRISDVGLAKICKKHNIEYRQENVFKRLLMTIELMVGKTKVLRIDGV
jgi:hypothetical protein